MQTFIFAVIMFLSSIFRVQVLHAYCVPSIVITILTGVNDYMYMSYQLRYRDLCYCDSYQSHVHVYS